MRALASIQRVTDIRPIPNADAIELIKCRGWSCVSKKDTFKVNDLAVFHEVDSFVPVLPQYDFLGKGSSIKSMIFNGEDVFGYRLKTVVLRQQISQGLALPLSEFPQIKDPVEGMDVTSLLGIKLYEAPMAPCLAGDARGVLPGFLKKTDEDRIQILLPWLDEYRGRHWYRTVKLDGASGTIYKHEGDFGVCNRTLNLLPTPNNTLWKIADKYELASKLPDGYAIQGECVGEGINGNRHKLKGQDFYVFYVYDINKGIYLELEDMQKFCSDLGMKTVPVDSADFILDHTLEQLLEMADGPCPLNPKLLREGFVYRLKGEGNKISFKTISNEYLLKYGL